MRNQQAVDVPVPAPLSGPRARRRRVPEAPAHRLARYRPHSLSPQRWSLAGPAVRDLVLAAGPGSAQVAIRLASQVCDLLASGVWDGQTAPDLAGLLTGPEADGFAATRRNPRSRRATRTDLRRLARAAHPTTTPPVATVVTPAFTVASGFWPHAAHLGPFTALAAAYEARGGSLHGQTFHRLEHLLGDGPDLTVLLAAAGSDGGAGTDGVAGTARGEGTGTLAAARTAASLLAEVTSHLPREGSAMSSSSPPAQRPARNGRKERRPLPRRRVSAAAAKRAAAQAVAAAAAGQTRAAATPPATVPADVAGAIDAYRPKKVTAEQWGQVRDVTQALLTAFAPTSPRVTNQAGHLTRFALWVVTRPERGAYDAPLTPADVSVDGLLEAYLAHTATLGVSASSRASQRTVIRRALQGMSGRPRPTRIPYLPVQAPYTPRECADLVRLARNQPTRAKRRQLSAVVALGVGAGLDGRDQRHITPRHIHHITVDGRDLILVEVTGERPRTVAVRDEYAALLREALALHAVEHRGDDTPLYGVKLDRRSVVTPVKDGSVTADGRPVEVNASRLRNTWLVAAMCSPVPLNVLLPAAGLRSARTLTDLLAHCPTPDPDTVAAVLAALPTPPPADVDHGEGRPS